MAKYTVIITTHEDRRLHYRTSNIGFLKHLYACAANKVASKQLLELSMNELTVFEAYLDHPKACEILDNHTKRLLSLPV